MKKMKKRSNGFTLTELAIVIAVIAILIAVLVPTFVSLINSANESSDKQLVKNINTALSVDEAINGEVNTMSDALAVAAENGYNVDKLTPASSGDIVWDQDSNRFLLINEEGEIVYYDSSVTSADVISTKYKLWYIATSASDVENGTYSYYLNYETDSVEAKYGVDVGNNEDVTVTITGTSVAATIIVNTNGGTLTVDAENYDVSSYGRAQSVTITAVSMTSFHVYGEVTGTITLTKGHLDIQASSTVSSVYVTVDKNTSGNVKVSNSSSNQIQISANDNEVASTVASGVSNATALQVDETVKSYFNGGLGTEANPFQISTSTQFTKIYYVSQNYSTYGYSSSNKVYYELTNNITLTTYLTYSSGIIAYGGNLYYGILDGNGYTLDATGSADYSYNTNIFYVARDSVIENLNVILDGKTKSIIYASYGIEFNNVETEGNITTGGNQGAFIIYAYYGTHKFTNCTNGADITSSIGAYGDYSAAFVGYARKVWSGVDTETYLYFDSCKNTGKITCDLAAMFLGNNCGADSVYLYITNCTNEDTIRSTHQVDDKGNANTPSGNGYIAVGASSTVYVNGINYSVTTYEDATKNTAPKLSNIAVGPSDIMTISLSDDYYTITESDQNDVSYYIISFGAYVNVNEENGGGTARYYITLTIQADDENWTDDGAYVSALQKLQFIDLTTYLSKMNLNEFDENADNVIAIGSGYMVSITEDEVTTYYYLVNNENYSCGSTGIKSAQIIGVAAYSSSDKLLSSVSAS